jgi:hypothetical protein
MISGARSLLLAVDESMLCYAVEQSVERLGLLDVFSDMVGARAVCTAARTLASHASGMRMSSRLLANLLQFLNGGDELSGFIIPAQHLHVAC